MLKSSIVTDDEGRGRDLTEGVRALPVGTKETMKYSVRMVTGRAENRSKYFPNKSQKNYRLSHVAWC
jgi:hypothetical protein